MAASQLLAHDVFSYLRPEEINAIDNASEIIERPAGEVVYTQGEEAKYLWVVLDGQVALQLPGKKGFSILIESLGRGAIFGASASFEPGNYMLTAQCLSNSKILKIEAAVLRRLMDNDSRMGYALQKHISDLYFKRYIETMRKLQAIVMSIPLEAQ
ncbi:MAG: cyclic nucleotide-binding domain-containing protein [Candidatus Binataceae bacterium]